jgi:hypothetical protein
MFQLIKLHKVINFFNQIRALSAVVDFESGAVFSANLRGVRRFYGMDRWRALTKMHENSELDLEKIKDFS